ncbi:MAG: efflux RND transporter periplasmic adaptor subunit [Deferrisomatales bacterium]|nr:efflux RND transporter periplasmic adaptor subunit [Deferrisomatales bacterium]
MRSAISWIVTLFLVGLIVAVVLFGASREELEVVPPKRRLANVEVATVKPRTYREVLELPARVEAREVAAVTPEFGGKLASWHVAEGARVARGQRVAELDTELLRAELGELQTRKRSAELGVQLAQAGLATARAGLESTRQGAEVQALTLEGARADRDLAETEFQRMQSLVEQGVMDQARLDTVRNARTQAEIRVNTSVEGVAGAELAIRSAEARVVEARAAEEVARSAIAELDAAIAGLELRIDKAVLRAPIAGRLEEYLVEAGEVVQNGTPVARVYDLATLRAVVNVPDRYVAFLDRDNPAVAEYIRLERPQAHQEVAASVRIPGLPKLTGGEGQGLELPARVARIAQAADADSNTFAVELAVDNPGEALKHGVIVRGRIAYLTYPEAIVIPVRAVQVTDAGPRVIVVVREDGRDVARVRDIEPSSVQGDELLVLAGLEAGERLVVSGWKGLVSGEPVQVLLEDGVQAAVGGE